MTRNTSPMPTNPRRRALSIGAGALLTAALVVAAPLAASAHVTVTPEDAVAGGYSVLTFAFSHGCDGSPTTALAIDIPDGVASVAPQIEPGWTIERVGADEGIPTRLVYIPDAPVESGLRAALNVQVSFSDDTGGRTVAFPVVQTCAEGETAWTEIAAEGEDPHDLDAPAPIVTVATAGAEADAGHGGPGHDAAADEGEATAGASDALPIALGATGLVLGAAALGVAIAALRRARRA